MPRLAPAHRPGIARRHHRLRPGGKFPSWHRRADRTLDESGATASLELLALTPLLVLLVLFVLWAGRSARAGLVADLAAEEAAVAAALCCDAEYDAEKDGPHADPELRRELMAETVLGSRPGLDHLCIDGPVPDPPPGSTDGGFVTETAQSFYDTAEAKGFVHGARVIEVHFRCETDGAVAPLRGLFPTVTMRGRASQVTVYADGTRITVAPATAAEGDNLVFKIMLNEPAVEGIELTCITQDETATSTIEPLSPEPDGEQGEPEPTIPERRPEDDFFAVPEDCGLGGLIEQGEKGATVEIAAIDEDEPEQPCEGNETFKLIVTASSSTLAMASGDSGNVRLTATGTITDEADCSVQSGT